MKALKIAKINLSAALRKKANEKISNICKGNAKQVKIDEISKALKSFGIVLLQEDNTEWSGILIGTNSSATIAIGPLSSHKEIDGTYFYTPYDNSLLAIQWYKITDSVWETNAYLS